MWARHLRTIRLSSMFCLCKNARNRPCKTAASAMPFIRKMQVIQEDAQHTWSIWLRVPLLDILHYETPFGESDAKRSRVSVWAVWKHEPRHRAQWRLRLRFTAELLRSSCWPCVVDRKLPSSWTGTRHLLLLRHQKTCADFSGEVCSNLMGERKSTDRDRKQEMEEKEFLVNNFFFFTDEIRARVPTMRMRAF